MDWERFQVGIIDYVKCLSILICRIYANYYDHSWIDWGI